MKFRHDAATKLVQVHSKARDVTRLHRPARLACCALSLIRRLCFPVYCSSNNILLSLRSSTHRGCIQIMLTAGLLKALCVNIIMHVFGFRLYLLFILLAVSFAALPWSPPSQPDSCSAVCGWGRAWPFGRASTLAFLDCSKVNGKPASRLF